MDERQTLALQALRELLDNPDRDKWDKLVAASRTLIKAIETGQSARRLADVIMIDRTATAAAEIATLRQKLTAAEARIREMGQHNMIRTSGSRRGSRAFQRSTTCVNAWLHFCAT